MEEHPSPFVLFPSSQISNGVSGMPSPHRAGVQSARQTAFGLLEFMEPSSHVSPGSMRALPQKSGSSAIKTGGRHCCAIQRSLPVQSASSLHPLQAPLMHKSPAGHWLSNEHGRHMPFTQRLPAHCALSVHALHDPFSQVAPAGQSSLSKQRGMRDEATDEFCVMKIEEFWPNDASDEGMKSVTELTETRDEEILDEEREELRDDEMLATDDEREEDREDERLEEMDATDEEREELRDDEIDAIDEDREDDRLDETDERDEEMPATDDDLEEERVEETDDGRDDERDDESGHAVGHWFVQETPCW